MSLLVLPYQITALIVSKSLKKVSNGIIRSILLYITEAGMFQPQIFEQRGMLLDFFFESLMT